MDAHAQLLNWARWAHSIVVDLEIPEPPAFAYWASRNDWDSGWGDQESVPAPVPPPIDELAAIETDKLLLRIPICHWHIIRRHYYRQKLVDEEDLAAAQRALIDVQQKNA